MNPENQISKTTSGVASSLSRNWWLIAIRGLIAVLFGIATFFMPSITILTVVYLFGLFALADGLLSLAVAVNAPKRSRLGGFLIGGIIGIIAGILAFAMPGVTALTLVLLFGAWAMVTGVMEVVAAVKLRKEIANEWLLILTGLASVLFGAVIFFRPVAGALILAWWIGAYALGFGFLLLFLAYRAKSWQGGFGELAPRTS